MQRANANFANYKSCLNPRCKLHIHTSNISLMIPACLIIIEKEKRKTAKEGGRGNHERGEIWFDLRNEGELMCETRLEVNLLQSTSAPCRSVVKAQGKSASHRGNLFSPIVSFFASPVNYILRFCRMANKRSDNRWSIFHAWPPPRREGEKEELALLCNLLSHSKTTSKVFFVIVNRARRDSRKALEEGENKFLLIACRRCNLLIQKRMEKLKKKRNVGITMWIFHTRIDMFASLSPGFVALDSAQACSCTPLDSLFGSHELSITRLYHVVVLLLARSPKCAHRAINLSREKSSQAAAGWKMIDNSPREEEN